MNFAHLMVLIAALLPYLTVGGAKSARGYDNAKPRDPWEGLTGWRQRALWAHENHFEAFAPFAAGVALAEIAHAPQARIDLLAGIFIAARILYTGIYVAGLATLRTALWIVGVICVVWLLALSL